MENPVIIFGAKGLGKVALEIFKSNGVDVLCFLDDDKTLHQTEIEDVTILGSTEDENYTNLLGKKAEAFVASDDMKYRKSLVNTIVDEYKAMPVNAIHSRANVASSAIIGHGNLIANGATIDTYATVGNHCIINANALVNYEATIGDFVQIGSGAIVNANVTIEDGAFIGSGAILVSGITIGKNAQIGAGSVVIASVEKGKRVFGNPAAAL